MPNWEAQRGGFANFIRFPRNCTKSTRSSESKNNSIDFKKLEMSGLNPQTIGGRIKAVFTGNSYDEATLERYIQLGIDATNGNLTGQQLRDIQDKPGDSPLEKKAKALIRAAHDQYQKWLAANDDARRWHKTADEREAERVAEETKRKEAEERERLAKEREDRWEKRADEERRERLTAEAEARADRKRADDVIDKIDRYMERLPAPARLELHLRAPIEEWAMPQTHENVRIVLSKANNQTG